MGFQEKARDNYEVANRICGTQRQGDADSAASRLYYAAYHAVLLHLNMNEIKPAPYKRDGRDGWTHDAVRQWMQAEDCGYYPRFEKLWNLRYTADYDRNARVKLGHVQNILPKAKGLIERYTNGTA